MAETIKARLTADGTQFRREFMAAEGHVGRLGGMLNKLGGILAGALTIRSGFTYFQNLQQEIGKIGDAADRLRLPVEEVQRLSLAANMADTDVSALVKQLGRAQIAATEAARGNQTLQQAFANLGISAEEFAKMSPEKQLAELADAYANAADRGTAFADLSKILGRGVSNLIPLLKSGADGIAEISRNTRTLGEKDVRSVEAMSDAFEVAMTNMKTAAAQGLMPVLMDLSEWATSTDFSAVADDIERVTGSIANLKKSVGGLLENSGFSALLNWAEEMGRRFAEMSGGVESIADAANGVTPREASRTWADGVRRETWTPPSGPRELDPEEIAEVAAERVSSETAVTAEMREQAALAKDLERSAAETARLRERVGRKIFEEQSPETRRAAAQAGLQAALAEAGVADLETLRQRIGRAGSAEEEAKLLAIMERALALRDDIRDANQDIADASAEVAKNEERAAVAAKLAAEQKQAALDMAERQRMAAADFQADTEALRLEVQGRKDMADALREEVRMRGMAADMAEQMGISEGQALDLLREQARLRRQISEQEGGGARGRPRQGIRGAMDGVQGASGVEGATGGLGRRPGLREDILRRRGEMRTLQTNRQENAARFWERQLDLQEQLVKKFGSLGVV